MNLTHDAMLVTLRIHGWSGHRYDRSASQYVAVHHDAATTAGRYNKRLLPKAALAALNATLNEARKTHYNHTLPWDDVGARLLPVANYERYTASLNSLIERMLTERSRFIADYDYQVEQARLDLGRLFRADDYPSRDELRGRFSAHYRIVPVPDSGHFLAELGNGASERVRRDIEQHVRERLNGALGDLYRRLGEAVGHVCERLTEDENGRAKVFRDSLIENLRELVDTVPRLNLFGDKHLERLCLDVQNRIARVEPDVLRPTAASAKFDPAVRRRVKRDAEELAAHFAGYFGAERATAHHAEAA
ncbi:hypothetical protein [Candidatus Rariloculus sp.]|uniref:hypothetical protein n=1 Tax=Candidatus Rariloculus sp. TaxID=3101265 RepID=UPI003D12E4CE